MTQALGVRLEAVRRLYPSPDGDVAAVAAIDLAIDPGSAVAVVGPSGCGKSTLLGMIGGLELPTGGRVWLDGTEMSALSDAARVRFRREQIGFVFQTYDLLPFLTALENVSFQLALNGSGRDRDLVHQLLERLGLAGHWNKLPDQLSGGQRQRVAIARALVHGPGLLLADEPTGELDSESAGQVMDLLLEARAAIGTTLVVVTHDRRVAERLDRVVTLKDGHVVGDTAQPGIGVASHV